jgi:16S rRNA (adenine1518-N6/adenine1519-N6)-dimethyltransferase
MRQPLGQHFLRDPRVVEAILTAAELKKSETALEIGPGKAILTEPLAARVARLVAIELDRELAANLQKRFRTQTTIEIIQADFLKTNLAELFPAPSLPPKIKVLGNIPYAITAPIFEKLLAWPGWETGVFLIQREVADRLRAVEGSKAFGLLTLAVQLFAQVELILDVAPEAFSPPPEVHSSVIRLRRKVLAGLPPEDTPAFFDFARAAFRHRRKTVVNSVAMATEIPKKQLSQWLQSQQLNPALRAEAISLSDYVRIARPWAIYRREIELTGRPSTSTISEHF